MLVDTVQRAYYPPRTLFSVANDTTSKNMFLSAFKKGCRVLYSTAIHPRVYGEVIGRARNRAFYEVRSESGEVDIIHKGDIICTL